VKYGGDIADPRNSLTLCITHHYRHHANPGWDIPLDVIPDEAFEFARELLGDYAEDYFKRYYGATDTRLAA
jgi:hypothetical protein